MARNDLPPASLTLDRATARRFLLAHQRLWPPRALAGKAGILDYIGHVGSIQFDPIDVVGRNADLVLQSRVADHSPPLLAELLYGERLLIDGWDKMAAIHLAADRPYFARHRARRRRQYGDPANPLRPRDAAPIAAAPDVLRELRERGPLSANDLDHQETIHWSWGQRTRLGRAALEILYARGEVGIHHRAGTRRYFDLIERLLPAELLAAPDPNATDEEYQDWHVRRRVGGLGLANPGAAEYWLAIEGVKSQARRATLARLVERGELLAVAVDDVPGRTLFMRSADLPILDKLEATPGEPRASFLAPLDNALWDRVLLRWLFDFDYSWEVYKPADRRRYGYYVLPVLYGDRFVARLDPAFDKKARELTVKGWWWEPGVRPDEAMRTAVADCFQAFAGYLRARLVRLAPGPAADAGLEWLPARLPDRSA